MTESIFDTRTSEGGLNWMLHQKMIFRRTAKDPETFATVQGFILSDRVRDAIGSNLVKLVAKATKKGNGEVRNLSVRDAFLTASMGAVLEIGRVPLTDDEMASCANIIFALLPMRRLEEAGLADRMLRTIARDRSSAEKLQNLFRLRTH